jgi:hypothetical protein
MAAATVITPATQPARALLVVPAGLRGSSLVGPV